VAEFWDLTDHTRGALAEALVAEALYLEDADTWLHSPRHPGFDVESVRTGRRVDAKAATLLDVDLDGTGEVTAVEWDGGASPLVAKEATISGSSSSIRSEPICCSALEAIPRFLVRSPFTAGCF
jgi:hypothetical protein